ncbi:chitin deacetylase [Terramyces sp. JEL0728]|nr:chitin deacetylase [Terramyces sp. JEL0728]
MNYPANEVGTPVSGNPTFNSQYQAAANIKTGPGVDWEKSTCVAKTDWALTFDDGPSQHTPEVVSQLTKHNFRGTFFVVGAQVKKYPELLVQAYKAGMEIGIHTWSHPVMTSLSNEQIIAEIMYTYHIIKDVIGVECRYFRAPYGTTDTRLRGIAQALGFVMIRWNRDTGDATTNGRSLKPQFDAFMKQPVIGTISLEHDLHAETAELAYYGMDKLSKSPYTERTISECTGEKPYRNIQGNPPAQSTQPKISTGPSPTQPSTNIPKVTFNGMPTATPIPTGPPSNSVNNYFSSPVTVRTQSTVNKERTQSSAQKLDISYLILLLLL